MIHIDQLGFAYNGQPVLTDISAHIPKGECVALLGANGSGKSTLLMLLTGLYSPGRGQVRIGNLRSPGQERNLRRSVGLLLQDADLQILGATVQEDLRLGLGAEGKGLEAAWSLAGRFDLQDKWETPVQHLSGGQKRKLCLAGMLLRHPEVLLYDEPFSGLDYPAMLELRSLLKAHAAQGITQIVAAHDVEPLIGVATGCLVLDQGSLVSKGSLPEVMDDLARFKIRPPCSWQREKRLFEWE